jgi:hypothetical protein
MFCAPTNSVPSVRPCTSWPTVLTLTSLPNTRSASASFACGPQAWQISGASMPSSRNSKGAAGAAGCSHRLSPSTTRVTLPSTRVGAAWPSSAVSSTDDAMMARFIAPILRRRGRARP